MLLFVIVIVMLLFAGAGVGDRYINENRGIV